MRRRTVVAICTDSLFAAVGAIVHALIPDWWIWIWGGVLCASAVALVVALTKADQWVLWRLRGGTAGNQHEPYQIDVRETSEVSFRPFLRVAVEVRVANGSDTPLHIQSVHLGRYPATGID